jgi:uncharacterized protein (DUF983 family)
MSRTKLQAILDARCPRCREGKLFTHPGWNVAKFDQMPERCPHCGVRYEVEPGFFYGAMFVSYAFSVGLMVALGVVIYVLFDDPDNLWLGYILPITVISLLAVPFNFRISRILFIHLFSGIEYDPHLAKPNAARPNAVQPKPR